MTMAFIGTFMAAHAPWTRVPFFIYSAISLWYRVHCDLHTTEQIAAGILVGYVDARFFDEHILGDLMEWLQQNLLNCNGQLPMWLMLIPAIVGVMFVRHLKRRVMRWIHKQSVGTAKACRRWSRELTPLSPIC